MIPFKAKRDTVEPTIVRALEQMGCLVYRMSQPVDLLIQLPGTKRLVLADVKTPRKLGGKDALTASQKALIAAGWQIEILRSQEDAVAMFNALRRAA